MVILCTLKAVTARGIAMKLTVLGCSDAFGSGGRLQTCFHVSQGGSAFLIDCGATALIGLERQGIDPNTVQAIFITHLHGDHFSGLVWWLVHAVHVGHRTQPLTVTGPAGIEKRVMAAAEALFPGSSTAARGFALTFLEYTNTAPLNAVGVTVTPYEVSHPSGAPPYALRISTGAHTVTFSGDTEWTESLIPASSGADLFIADCYGFESPVRFHMNWATIKANLPRITAKRILLTHMGHDMLKHAASVASDRVLVAHDGLVIDI
jgi:ribonuclease BN (tRNA processing enzyme)